MSEKWLETIPDDFGHWLAGYTDGDGCFTFKLYRIHFGVSFSINCRDDNANSLYYIQSTLDIGNVRFKPGRPNHLSANGKGYNSKPTAEFVVGSLEECRKLAALFIKYPLRTKKAKDFEIWKTAVGELTRNGSGYATPYLLALKQTLHEIREYNAPDIEFVESLSRQLEFDFV